MISNVLIYLYAVLIIFITCYQMFAKKIKMPIWLFILNIAGGVILALKPLSNFWLYFGILYVLAISVFDGHEIFGKIHPSYFFVQLIFSLVLALLAFKNL